MEENDSSGLSISLLYTFNHQIYPSNLPIFFKIRHFYRSNLPVIMVKNLNHTFFVVHIFFLAIKSTGKFGQYLFLEIKSTKVFSILVNYVIHMRLNVNGSDFFVQKRKK